MYVRLLVVDLPESSHLLSDLSVRQEGAKRGVVFYFVLEREFRATKQTNRNAWLSDSSETTGDRPAELGRHQLVGSGCDKIQTIITHRSSSSAAQSQHTAFLRALVRNAPGEARF